MPAVYAEPSHSGTQAEFQRVQQQINSIDDRLDIIVEQYNASAFNLSKTERELRSYRQKLGAAENKLHSRQDMLNKRFASVYRQGGLSYLEVLLNTKSIDQFLFYLELIERQSKRDTKTIAELRLIEQEIKADSVLLLEKKQKQKAMVAELKVKKDKIASQLKEKNNLLAKIKTQLAQYQQTDIKIQLALRNKLKTSFKLALHHKMVSRGESRSGGGSGVVGIAMNELGKPYCWGANGPGSFDCSGLTSYVYGQMGVSLPHSSRAQYDCGQHVSRDELQAGDLVFFAHGGTISHVGVYVGGGNFIHAPSTGDVVKISNLGDHDGYVGAVRP